MRDPSVDNLDDAAYVITWERYADSVLLKHPLYGEKVKAILLTQKDSDTDLGSTVAPITDKVSAPNATKKGYHTVYTHFIRTPEGTIDEIHTLDNHHSHECRIIAD